MKFEISDTYYKSLKAPEALKEKTVMEMKKLAGRHSLKPVAAVCLCAVSAAGIGTVMAYGSRLYDPDDLNFTAEYMGNGIVEIEIYNGTDKTVYFQDSYRLGSFDNTIIPELSDKRDYNSKKVKSEQRETVRIDLKKSYDISGIEQDDSVYYILLTDDNFVHEHDWQCSFRFVQQASVPDEEPEADRPETPTVQPEYYESADSKFSFYFEGDPDSEDILSDYYEAVQKDISAMGDSYVSARSMTCFPEYSLFVTEYERSPLNNGEDNSYMFVSGRGAELDHTHRCILGEIYYDISDGEKVYNRKDGCFQIYVEYSDKSGGMAQLPVFTGVSFAAEEVSSEKYCFIHGRFYKFSELEDMKIFEDERYVIYGINRLLFDDTEAYLKDNIKNCDTDEFEQTFERAMCVCGYFEENISDCFEYVFYGQ